MCRKRRINGAVSRNNRIKRVARLGAWTGTLKNPTKSLWRWEPDRRSNFFSPPAHLCRHMYITEISLQTLTHFDTHWDPQRLQSACTFLCRRMYNSTHILNRYYLIIPVAGRTHLLSLNLSFVYFRWSSSIALTAPGEPDHFPSIACHSW